MTVRECEMARPSSTRKSDTVCGREANLGDRRGLRPSRLRSSGSDRPLTRKLVGVVFTKGCELDLREVI